MRIVVLPPRGVLFAADSPWNSLLAGLRACGHEVDGYGQFASRPEALVTLNDQPEARRLQRSFSIPEGRSALVLLEPRVTAPQMYTKRVVTRYAIRFAASPSWAAAIGARPFLWPQKIVPGPTLEPCHKFDATDLGGIRIHPHGYAKDSEQLLKPLPQAFHLIWQRL